MRHYETASLVHGQIGFRETILVCSFADCLLIDGASVMYTRFQHYKCRIGTPLGHIKRRHNIVMCIGYMS